MSIPCIYFPCIYLFSLWHFDLEVELYLYIYIYHIYTIYIIIFKPKIIKLLFWQVELSICAAVKWSEWNASFALSLKTAVHNLDFAGVEILYSITVRFSQSKTVIVSIMSVWKWAVRTYLHITFFILFTHVHRGTIYVHPFLCVYIYKPTIITIRRISINTSCIHPHTAYINYTLRYTVRL